VAKVGTSNQNRTISLKACNAQLKIIIIIGTVSVLRGGTDKDHPELQS